MLERAEVSKKSRSRSQKAFSVIEGWPEAQTDTEMQTPGAVLSRHYCEMYLQSCDQVPTVNVERDPLMSGRRREKQPFAIRGESPGLPLKGLPSGETN